MFDETSHVELHSLHANHFYRYPSTQTPVLPLIFILPLLNLQFFHHINRASITVIQHHPVTNDQQVTWRIPMAWRSRTVKLAFPCHSLFPSKHLGSFCASRCAATPLLTPIPATPPQYHVMSQKALSSQSIQHPEINIRFFIR
jgi:hypothetical protein